MLSRKKGKKIKNHFEEKGKKIKNHFEENERKSKICVGNSSLKFFLDFQKFHTFFMVNLACDLEPVKKVWFLNKIEKKYEILKISSFFLNPP